MRQYGISIGHATDHSGKAARKVKDLNTLIKKHTTNPIVNRSKGDRPFIMSKIGIHYVTRDLMLQ